MKTLSFYLLLLHLVSSLPYAHWDECKEQACTGLTEGWMCCEVTEQYFEKGDIPLDKGYSKICVSPDAKNYVPKGVKTEFVQEGDRFWCDQKDFDDYSKALMARSKNERGYEGLVVSAAIGGSAVLIVGFFGWAYYMFGMNS